MVGDRKRYQKARRLEKEDFRDDLELIKETR